MRKIPKIYRTQPFKEIGNPILVQFPDISLSFPVGKRQNSPKIRRNRMQNIEFAPENPFSAPLQDSPGPSNQLASKDQWDAVSEILAVAVLRNRFRRQQQSD